MSQLPSPGKVTWNTKIKFAIVFPSVYDTPVGTTPTEYIVGVADEVYAEGIGYEHEDIDGITNWGLGKKTKPSNNKNGRIVISETEWLYTFLRWLAASDSRFDIKAIELEQTQNPGFGQWAAGQESYLGCYIQPYSKSYEKGEQPYSTFPFTFTQFEYIKDTARVTIGQGIFTVAGLPPTPPSASP